jgi:hypothetical protein
MMGETREEIVHKNANQHDETAGGCHQMIFVIESSFHFFRILIGKTVQRYEKNCTFALY